MSNYVAGGSLSYNDYLQARSFEDAVVSEISQQTRLIIATNVELQREKIAVAEALHSGISAGLDQLSYDMHALTDGIAELNAAFHWAFTELLVAVGKVDTKLEELIRIAKTPAQTWAYEQFEIARDAFRQELYPESLEYLGRAINGHAGNTGYRLEFRFYFLLGTIRLGSNRNTAQDIIDLSEAELAFCNAARYARRDQPKEAGRAFLAAGWAAYCNGSMDSAKQHTEEAIALHPTLAEGHFQLAKIWMHVGEPNCGLPCLRRAIEQDRCYAIKAAADDDFRAYMVLVDALLSDLRSEAKERANKALWTTQRYATDSESRHIEDYWVRDYVDFSGPRHALLNVTKALQSDTYFGYLDAISLCEIAKDGYKRANDQFGDIARAAIRDKVGSISDRMYSINKGDIAQNWSVSYLLCFVIAMMVGFVQCGRAKGLGAGIVAFVGNSLVVGVLLSIVSFVAYQVWQFKVRTQLIREMVRLERIESEINSL